MTHAYDERLAARLQEVLNGGIESGEVFAKEKMDDSSDDDTTSMED